MVDNKLTPLDLKIQSRTSRGARQDTNHERVQQQGHHNDDDCSLFVQPVRKQHPTHKIPNTRLNMTSDLQSFASDEQMPRIMQQGAEKMVVQGTAGFLIGLASGIVLARGGAAGARRVMSGLGAGVGIGMAWTKTSIEIDAFLAEKK
eukprot:Nitzschia sp. Nitz4//scaffold1_size375055//95444//95993//NITZ4_000237-RA/size375055-snap-gene-0.241-mRNA-1//-1//CDS//3329540928//7252//frame0